MSDDSYGQRLQQIWQQGHRHMAVAFLKRAISLDSSLAEIAAALRFDEVAQFVSGIRLRDVLMQETSRAGDSGGAPAANAAAPPQLKRTKKRRRRNPEQMKEIKGTLLDMLRSEPGSLDTTQLHESLVKLGHELDRITLNRLLSQLEEERHITCLGGRPKAWRQISARSGYGRESGSLGLA